MEFPDEPDSWAWSWGPMSAGSEPLQVQGCLMNAEHRASGAFAKGVREKVYVQSKAKHSILLLLITSLSWVLCWWKGTEVVRTCMCMRTHAYTQTHTHSPQKEWKEKRKPMPSTHNAVPDWLACNLQIQWCQPTSLCKPSAPLLGKGKRENKEAC